MTQINVHFLSLLVCLSGMVNVMHGQQSQWFYDIPYLEVSGVDLTLLSLDVGIPAGDVPAPVLIYVHGGGWTSGDKSNVFLKGDYFTSRGWVFVSVNYRLSPLPFEIDNLDRIKYPVHTNDVASAVAFVLDHVDDYGGDSDRVSLLGHSTGAHIVSQIAADPDYLNRVGYDPSMLRCVCSNDIAAYDVPAWLASDDANADLYYNAFGLDTATWIQASPKL
jgi:acetyl esterase/lipase